MRPLVLRELAVADVRNIESAVLVPSPRVTVVSGPNGHGKTSLIEAAYLAATSKSFRTNNLADVARHGCPRATIRARFSRDGIDSEQDLTIEGGRRRARVEGKRPKSLASFATRSPVVCFHTGELELSQGPASARRTLLDRVALFIDPLSIDDRDRYETAMKSRKRALEERGPRAAELEPFEAIAATHGARLAVARGRTAAALDQKVRKWFSRIASPGLVLDVGYAAGGSDDAEVFQRELAARREKDLARGAATFGPQRDDLSLSLDQHRARQVASQGQHRAITLALKLAELDLIAEAAQAFPLFLLDDVSSELDRDRTAALFEVLSETEGQLLITTTRPELIDTARFPDRLDLRMTDGALEA